MEKNYDHKIVEKKISKKWADAKAFEAKRDPNKKPYTIVLPPPNASGKMHVGNALMIAIEDALIRQKRMQGYSALWVPGTDHAGFETQTTFERELKKQGKSRFDYDRATLYKMIWDFVQSNKGLIEEQIVNMGASVDWSRYTFSLDDGVVNTVLDTFAKMEKDGLIYRSDYVVNYSFKWGTTFSDAEIVTREQKDPLYFIKFGPITVATVRPESKLGDTALAVNPEDPRYKKYIGTEVEFDDVLGKNKLKVISDPFVDPEFGTGVLKVTPAHAKDDYELALRHNLPVKEVFGIDGKIVEGYGKYSGLKILECRKQIVADLTEMGLIEKIDENYTHMVPVDYRSEDYIEQLVLPNWFVNVDHAKFSLKQAAADVLKNGELNIFPAWQKVTYERWVENMRDWAISRQVVWGIRVPVWYDIDSCPQMSVNFLSRDGKIVSGKVGDLLKTFSLEEIESGLQSLIAPQSAKYVVSKTKPLSGEFLQGTDTFDTWFSSGQWPIVTLGYPDSDDFNYFYPTSVLETGWEIITRWVSRMVMFGLYLTGKSPFKDVYLHGRVMAKDGKKMSKSLGNVVNPEEYQEKYGTDALRMGLVSGTANGKDFAFPHDRVLAYRNFANKIWNMARFMIMMFETTEAAENTEAGLEKVPMYNSSEFEAAAQKQPLSEKDKLMLSRLNEVIIAVDENLEKYRFSDAADAVYQFMWHELADDYIEDVKKREGLGKIVGLSVLRHVYLNCLKLLHPFMPFVTEEIWENLEPLRAKGGLLALSSWPVVS